MRAAASLAALILSGAAAASSGAAERPARPAGPELALRFTILDNPAPGRAGFRAALDVGNRGAAALAASGWELYFNFGRAAESATGEVALTRVNGDLWRLVPTGRFRALEPGETRRLELSGRGSVTRRSEAPAGPYLVFADGRVERVELTVAPFTDFGMLRRAPRDRLPAATAGVLFERHRPLGLLPEAAVGRLVPTPLRLEAGPGELPLDAGWKIHHGPGLGREAALLAEALEPHLGVRPETVPGAPPAPGAIHLAIAPLGFEGGGAGGEAYRLTAARGSGVRIVGAGAAGVFYGIQTLRALLPAAPAGGGKCALPAVRVEDAPRFSYRGVHLDVARNFHRPGTVEKLLDLAAFYKLNHFHFHLTDDEGWRLPVRALPELTEIGGRRGHTRDERDRLLPSFGSGPDPDPAVSPGSGHYTRAELLAILRYARDRHIRVIPEIDVPGHARAAIRSMAARRARLLAAGRTTAADEFTLRHPRDRSAYRSVQGWDDNVVDVCMPSTYRFLAAVFDEIVDLWAEAEAALEEIHVGGDEVPAGAWRGSPACEALLRTDPAVDGAGDLPAYFLRRVNDLLAERGLATAGWEEIALAAAGPGEHAKRPNRELLDRDLRPWVWNNVWGWGAEDLGYRLANAGYRVVLANATNLYFDLAYDNHPEEPGYAWAGFVDTRKAWELVPLDLYKSARADLLGNPIDPATEYAGRARLSAAGQRRVRGIQGQLWAESSKSPALLEYQAFPKLLGLAERAWAAQPEWAGVEDTAERRRLEAVAWNEFANRLGRRELPRLDRLRGGVLYRLPPPGAVVRGGLLSANAAFPGLQIRYTTDGTEPVASSALYGGPVTVTGTVKLSTFDTRGRASRAVVAAVED